MASFPLNITCLLSSVSKQEKDRMQELEDLITITPQASDRKIDDVMVSILDSVRQCLLPGGLSSAGHILFVGRFSWKFEFQFFDLRLRYSINKYSYFLYRNFLVLFVLKVRSRRTAGIGQILDYHLYFRWRSRVYIPIARGCNFLRWSTLELCSGKDEF